MCIENNLGEGSLDILQYLNTLMEKIKKQLKWGQLIESIIYLCELRLMTAFIKFNPQDL